MNFTLDQLIFGILGSIIGAAIWEILLKKYSPSMAKFIFKLIIIRKEKFKNKMYEEISHGIYENNYKKLHGFISFFPVIFFIVLPFDLLYLTYKNINSFEKSISFNYKDITIADIVLDDRKKEVTLYDFAKGAFYYGKKDIILADWKNEIRKQNDVFLELIANKNRLDKDNSLTKDQTESITRQINILLEKLRNIQDIIIYLEQELLITTKNNLYFYYPICALLIVCGIVYLSYLVSIFYISDAKIHFYQCLNICKPYVEQKEIDLIISHFFLLRCKDDFVTVLKSLEEIAKKENIELPKFSVW